MSHRGIILSLCLAALALTGCSHCGTSCGLESREVEYLSEDIVDLMTNVFQAAENAYLGDSVRPGEIVDSAGPGNDYTVTYDLLRAYRLGLGYGHGRVTLRIEEDGRPIEDPLAFSLATTEALEVVLEYGLFYFGETSTRDSDVDFLVTLVATRERSRDPFVVDYGVDGDCFFGDTRCEVDVFFRSAGSPREGIVAEFSGGWGYIDDFDVYDILDLSLEFEDGWFRAKGKVGWRAYFEEGFGLAEMW